MISTEFTKRLERVAVGEEEIEFRRVNYCTWERRGPCIQCVCVSSSVRKTDQAGVYVYGNNIFWTRLPEYQCEGIAYFWKTKKAKAKHHITQFKT